MEPNNLGSNSFTDMVVGQSIPMLGQLGMWDGGACDDRLIVSKHPGRSLKGNSIGLQGEPQVHDLFHSSACGNKLTAISGSLDLTLALGEPVHWGLVNQMEGSSCRTASGEVMHQVGINKGGGVHRVSLGDRTVGGDQFSGVAIDRVHPVMNLGMLPID